MLYVNHDYVCGNVFVTLVLNKKVIISSKIFSLYLSL